MPRNTADITKPYFGFKEPRFKIMAALLTPILRNKDWSKWKDRFLFRFLFIDDSRPDAEEWNTLLTIYYSIAERLERIIAESEFNQRETPLFDITNLKD